MQDWLVGHHIMQDMAMEKTGLGTAYLDRRIANTKPASASTLQLEFLTAALDKPSARRNLDRANLEVVQDWIDQGRTADLAHLKVT